MDLRKVYREENRIASFQVMSWSLTNTNCPLGLILPFDCLSQASHCISLGPGLEEVVSLELLRFKAYLKHLQTFVWISINIQCSKNKTLSLMIFLSFFFFYVFFFISWRLITLQYCRGISHTLKWISHGFTCVSHPDPPSHLPLHPLPLGLPSAPGPSACLMHPTWAGDLFHPR